MREKKDLYVVPYKKMHKNACRSVDSVSVFLSDMIDGRMDRHRVQVSARGFNIILS